MDFPQDILERLQSLDETPTRLEWLLHDGGLDRVRGFIDRLEDAKRLYLEWSPKLRELASRSRKVMPPPSEKRLSRRDLAKLKIYERLIGSADRLRHKKYEIVICTLPVLGFPAAQRLWPGQEENVVLLTPKELSEWHDIYHHPDSSFWWFSYYHWEVQDPPKTDGIWAESRISVPKSEEPWRVISAHTWGSLAGGGKAELWSWNGKRAKFVENAGGWCC